MWNSLVPGLLLTAVAFSTSDVLPMILTSDQSSPLYKDGQIDNTFNYKGDLYNMFYTVPVYTPRHRSLREQSDYGTSRNKEKEQVANVLQERQYDDQGFRTEQWHNYPRQLDRLQDYLYNYYRHDTSKDYSDISRALATKVLSAFDKLRPPVFQNPRINTKTDETFNRRDLLEVDEDEIDRNINDEESINHAIIPFIKEKRQGTGVNIDLEVTPAEPEMKNTVSKRIFSLWSRLQDLSHKGHDLPHRRHMAFYALPNPSRGALTAQTRSQIRPPGSPLRWG